MTSESLNDPTTRVLPNMLICRATDLIPDYANCLVEKPTACPFVISFGNGFLCKHPDRKTIIANTKRDEDLLH